MYDNINFKIVNVLSYCYQKHVIKYCKKVYERSGKNLFWSIKKSGEVLNKPKAKDFNATSLSTYNFPQFTLFSLVI